MPAGEDLALMAHLMRRAGFGANRDDLEAYAARGYEATVEELLHPEEQPPFDDDLAYRYVPYFRMGTGIPSYQSYWNQESRKSAYLALKHIRGWPWSKGSLVAGFLFLLFGAEVVGKIGRQHEESTRVHAGHHPRGEGIANGQ